ncbi:acetyl-CoA synthetase-like protein [Punctularia strigosozonata HHB-11173 SS5]|uniref:acetyl-CoA synthetase-like protein n=1 Tax=Punctularia strigosozonata (strain HHB-11173) TaxID=741275 RepID=UPI0004416BD2|nr:acetyl-CoA synthetase-like protein [Punctularia strigosozonata HHB-11173 SS5]EIN12891.1 acetyl-CoA synthetase-like protein [Punctularia strigosozonata HHB-11173 SS5]
MNVHNFFFQRVHNGPESIPDNWRFLVDAGTERALSGKQFYERIRDGATVIQSELSLRKGRNLVGIVSENCTEYVTLIHALLASTVPVVPLSSYSTPFELAYLLRQSGVTHLFVSPHFLDLVRKVAKEAGLRDEDIYILDRTDHLSGRESKSKRKSFGELIESVRRKGVPRASVQDAPKDTLAYLLFSSGTTGHPKAVMVSHYNICHQMRQFLLIAQESGKVVPTELMVLPFHHTYGLTSVAFRSLLVPLTIVIMPKWDTRRALHLVQKYQVTRVPLVPSLVHQIVTYLQSPAGRKDRPTALASLVSIGSGAAYLPPALADELAKMAPKTERVTQGFGMSESTMTATSYVPDGTFGRTKHVPGSNGILLADMEAKLLREDGNEAGVNEPGELYLRGGNVAMGYWGKEFEKATRDTFLPDGWLRTGDIFRIDEHGNFFFEDRAKDTLKVSGMQVAPSEIEDVLLAHPDRLVIDATVAGVSGGRTSDEKVPRAWVVLGPAGKRKGAKASTDALDEWVRSRLSKYKWLRGGIEVVDQIPKSPTGKVLRRQLVEKYERRRGASAAKAKL